MSREVPDQSRAITAASLLAFAVGAAAFGAVAIGVLAIRQVCGRLPSDQESTFQRARSC
jgi:hypothetical protein